MLHLKNLPKHPKIPFDRKVKYAFIQVRCEKSTKKINGYYPWRLRQISGLTISWANISTT